MIIAMKEARLNLGWYVCVCVCVCVYACYPTLDRQRQENQEFKASLLTLSITSTKDNRHTS